MNVRRDTVFTPAQNPSTAGDEKFRIVMRNAELIILG